MTTLALEISHPASHQKRIEVLTPRSIALLGDGRGALVQNGHFGRGRHPEMLFMRWLRPTEAATFHCTAMRGGNAPAQVPRLNDVLRESGSLSAGDTLRWRDFVVVVSGLPELREPERAMVDAARTSDAALQVFADWLETKGHADQAEWTRLVLAPASPAGTQRMQALAPLLGPSARALVARGPVERCTRTGCSARWEALSLTAEAWLRTCAACERPVTWCENADVARSIAGPVVLDPATPRARGDLLPRPIVVG